MKISVHFALELLGVIVLVAASIAVPILLGKIFL